MEDTPTQRINMQYENERYYPLNPTVPKSFMYTSISKRLKTSDTST